MRLLNFFDQGIILNIVLSGLGGAILATLIVIINNKCKELRKEKNLFKGLFSEMKVNLEYLKHNYDTACQILNNKKSSGIFIYVRNFICVQILTSGEIKLQNETRKNIEHYLVTLDHLNQMIKKAESEKIIANESKNTIEKIKRYCRDDENEYKKGCDFVKKGILKIQNNLFSKKRYLRNNFMVE
ncbi:MAG: hypothetical protein K0B11_06825 [Mariniphaga sp.]|nr:hypothetical protein [Mariniphaga sp.]